MPYGGKYWNVGLSDPGKLSATKKQLNYLRSLTRVDHSGKGLTRDEASDLIDKAIEEKAEKAAGITQVQDQMFAALMRSAARAANEAGERWLREHPEPLFWVTDPRTGESKGVHGRIGSAHITWPPKGQFHKWLDETWIAGTEDEDQADRRIRRKYIQIPHHFSERYEADLQLACEKAAYEVLRRAGNTGGIKVVVTVEPGTVPEAA